MNERKVLGYVSATQAEMNATGAGSSDIPEMQEQRESIRRWAREHGFSVAIWCEHIIFPHLTVRDVARFFTLPSCTLAGVVVTDLCRYSDDSSLVRRLHDDLTAAGASFFVLENGAAPVDRIAIDALLNRIQPEEG